MSDAELQLSPATGFTYSNQDQDSTVGALSPQSPQTIGLPTLPRSIGAMSPRGQLAMVAGVSLSKGGGGSGARAAGEVRLATAS